MQECFRSAEDTMRAQGTRFSMLFSLSIFGTLRLISHESCFSTPTLMPTQITFYLLTPLLRRFERDI